MIVRRIVILHNSVEAEASEADQDVLVQARAVADALAELGCESTAIPCTLDLESVRQQLLAAKPGAVFNLVESLGGSDWLAHAMTTLLDALGLPYTGSPTEALLMTNHKLLAKQRLRQAGLPTPGWIAQSHADLAEDAAFEPGGRYILKTVFEHASVGIEEESVVRAADRQWLRARVREQSAKLSRPCFAEQFIDGREFNLSVLAGADRPQVLPAAEIDFSSLPPDRLRIVGYKAKWIEDSEEYGATNRRFDLAEADRPLQTKLRDLAARCWEVFGLGGYARVDFRVDPAGRPWILEVNANPCISPDAGFAAALTQAGISYPDAIERIVKDALNRPAVLGRKL